MGGVQGQASDIEIHTQEILKMRQRINEILSKHTRKSIKRIAQDTERDHFMSAEDAVAYGLVDSNSTRAAAIWSRLPEKSRA